MNVENISSFTSIDLLKFDNKKNIDYKKIASLISQNKKFCDIDLSEDIKSEDVNMKFDAVISNPPYQEEATQVAPKNNGQVRRKSIFHHFQYFADYCCKNMSVLIYPGVRWLHRSGKGMDKFGYEQLNDRRLLSVDFFSDARDVFKDSGIADGITIVCKKQQKKSNEFKYDYYVKSNNVPEKTVLKDVGDRTIPLNPNDYKIIEKVMKFQNKNKLSCLNNSILSQKLFEIESDFVEKNPDKVKIIDNPNSLIDYNKYIKLLANDKAGSAGRAKWYKVGKNIIDKDKNRFLNEWQVVVSSAHPGGQDGRDWQLEIIDNHSAFGRARVALKSFKTAKEAENFYKYVSSDIIRFAFLMSDEALTSLAKVVPDIGDYTNKNKLIDFGKNIDNQLMDLVGITKKEMAYIKNILN